MMQMMMTPVLAVWLALPGQVLPNGVASGDVTPTGAVLWARASTAGTLVFEVSDSADLSAPVARVEVPIDDVAVPARARVAGLVAGRAYHYLATDAAGARAEGRFSTPHVTGIHGLRFGVAGDWRGELAPFPAVANVPQRALDLFVALGDTIYADIPSPAVAAPQATTLDEFRAKHAEIYTPRFGLAYLADLRASTALLATIDDHEVANDFSGGAEPDSDPRFSGPGRWINETALYANGLQAFQEYHPVEDLYYDDTGDPVTAGRRKLYRRRVYGQDAALFLLDARSFRDPPVASITPGASGTAVADFQQAAFAPGRTLLGAAQIDALEQDLLAARADGVTWKFVFVPEPIQNFGPYLAGDRFEGYAAERTRLLRFIVDHDLRNVVFVAADIHGTVINNLDYRTTPDGPDIPTRAFEVTTGSVAFAPPFAPTLIAFADGADLGLFAEVGIDLYGAVARPLQDALVVLAGNILLGQFGYNPIGLDDADIVARLEIGQWVAVNTFGWTEFDIDPQTHALTVTTYGIRWYDADDLVADPARVIGRTPHVVSRVIVEADCPASAALACSALDRERPPPACGALAAPVLALMGAGLRVLGGTRRAKDCIPWRCATDRNNSAPGRCEARPDAVS